ncbi:MAG: Gfo/Idh/MocA family oxidoreductase [Bacteroidia bacterium]|nr:Gfo/Idh/MocA family oxidoreductase [Bacteroidia bacterium]
MRRIGIVGVGHFGKFHVKELIKIHEFDLIGFYDINPETSKTIQTEFGIKPFTSYEALLDEIDIIDIAVPTNMHFNCATEAIKKQKHVFIEKPVTITVEDAQNLIKLAEEASVKVQVGHIERFNPAFKAALPLIFNPSYIEIHRLQTMNDHAYDESIILKLMIHDIDIVISTINSNIKKINATGVKLINGITSIANARLEFDNGCVANITSSIVSPKNIIEYKIFQKEKYIFIDFLNRKAEVSIFKEDKTNKEQVLKDIHIESSEKLNSNSLKEEFISFFNCINNNFKPSVTLDDGFKALKVANEIIEKIKLSNDF